MHYSLFYGHCFTLPMIVNWLNSNVEGKARIKYISEQKFISEDTFSQCSMNSARLRRVCVISGMSWMARACSMLWMSSSCCISLSSVQHDTNAALNKSLKPTPYIAILQIPTGNCLVVAHLVCGLVACTGWLHCSRHVLESVGALERLLQG